MKKWLDRQAFIARGDSAAQKFGRYGACQSYEGEMRLAEAMTKSSIEETLIEVWRQALVENARAVKLGEESYPVRRTPKRGLQQVDFVFDGNEMRGLEQHPETKSRWAQLARSRKKVMQFLSEGRYIANVVDGKVTRYGREARGGTHG